MQPPLPQSESRQQQQQQLAALFANEVLDIEKLASSEFSTAGELLEVLGLGHHTEMFANEDVDLATIFFLDDHYLVEMGFSLSERIKFHRCMQLFKDAPPPPNRLLVPAANSAPPAPKPSAAVAPPPKRNSAPSKFKPPFLPESTSVLVVSVFDNSSHIDPMPVPADTRPDDRFIEALTKGHLKLKPSSIVNLQDENATTASVEEALLSMTTEFAIIYLCGRCDAASGAFQTYDYEDEDQTGVRLSAMRDTTFSPERTLFIVDGPYSSAFAEDVRKKNCAAVVSSSTTNDFVPYVLTQTFVNVLMGKCFSAEDSRFTLTSTVRAVHDVLRQYKREPGTFYPGGLASVVLGQARAATHPLLGTLTMMQADSADNKARLGVVVAVDEQLAQAVFFFDGSESWKDMQSEMRVPEASDFVRAVPEDVAGGGAGSDGGRESAQGAEETAEDADDDGAAASAEEAEEPAEQAEAAEAEDQAGGVAHVADDGDDALEEETPLDEEVALEEEAAVDVVANGNDDDDDDDDDEEADEARDPPPSLQHNGEASHVTPQKATQPQGDFTPSPEQEAKYARMRKMGLPEDAVTHAVSVDRAKAQSGEVGLPDL